MEKQSKQEMNAFVHRCAFKREGKALNIGAYQQVYRGEFQSQ